MSRTMTVGGIQKRHAYGPYVPHAVWISKGGRPGDGDGAVTDVDSNSGGIRFPDMGGGDWICSLSFLGN